MKQPSKTPFYQTLLSVVVLFGVSLFLLTSFPLSAQAVPSAADIDLSGLEPPTDGFSPVEARLEIPIPFVDLSAATRENDKITVPFLAQYISGVYQFLISIVGVVAGVFILVGGFQYLTAGGEQERVASAKRRITNALMGLILAFSSYVILFAINPDLLEFNALQLTTVDTKIFSDEFLATDEGGLISAEEGGPSTGTPPSNFFVGLGFPSGKPQQVCNKSGSGGLPKCSTLCKECPFTDAGGKIKYTECAAWDKYAGDSHGKKENMVKISGDGLSSNQLTDPITLGLLRNAGKAAEAKGYVIKVSSGWRAVSRQIKLACEDKHGTGSTIGHTLATPGGSFHGVGYALDISLYQNGDQKTCFGSKVQQLAVCRKFGIELAEIMFAAGFRRLNNEVWHFEPANAPTANCRCYDVTKCTYPPTDAQVVAAKAAGAGKSKGEQAKLLQVFVQCKSPANYTPIPYSSF